MINNGSQDKFQEYRVSRSKQKTERKQEKKKNKDGKMHQSNFPSTQEGNLVSAQSYFESSRTKAAQHPLTLAGSQSKSFSN